MEKQEASMSEKNVEALRVDSWKKTKGSISPIELDDFDQFLRNTPEYRRSDFATIRVSRDDPSKVIFFGEKPEDKDLAQFELMEDFENKCISVTCTDGDPEKLTPYLISYGFEKVTA